MESVSIELAKLEKVDGSKIGFSVKWYGIRKKKGQGISNKSSQRSLAILRVYSKLPNNGAGEINVQTGTFSKIIKRAYPNKSVQAGFYKILLHKKTRAGRNCHKINKRAGPNKCVQAGFSV